MSLKVELGELEKTLEPYGFAYLVSVGDGGRVHVLAVTPVLTDDGLVVGGVGRHSQANATERPDVTLTVAPAKATLHRPAPGSDGLRAGSDCVSVPLDS